MKPNRWFASTVPFVLSGALLIFGAGESAARIVLSPPIEVPAFAPDPYITEVSLAVLEDGSFAISRLYEPGLELLFFGPDGEIKKRRVIPLPPGTTGPLSGGIGSFGDRYFFAWSRLPSLQAHAAFFSREGNRLGKIFPWPYSETRLPYIFFHYAPGPTGRILPFFVFESGKDRFGRPAFWERSQMFGPGGFWGAPVEIGPEAELVAYDAAINAHGRFVVLFHRCPRGAIDEDECELGTQVFDRAWRPRSPLRTEALPALGKSDRTFVLGLARTGTHAVGWTREVGNRPGQENRLLIRLFGPDGLPASGELQISEPGVRAGGGLRPRATFANTFVVAWYYSPDDGKRSAHIRELNGKTGRLGEPILVAEDIKNFAWSLQMNSSGRGVLLWGDHVTLVTVVPDEESRDEE